MALDRSTQPIVKDASGVLVGVAQVRIGTPSLRDAGKGKTYTSTLAVGKSTKVAGTTNKKVILVKRDTLSAINEANSTALGTVTGSYAGAVDGAFLIRATVVAKTGVAADSDTSTAATAIDLISPYGLIVASRTLASAGIIASADLTALHTAASNTKLPLDNLGTTSGIALTGLAATGVKSGDTWSIPVWSNDIQNLSQSGIISPFSMFYDATDSVGGLKSASFQPKIDGVKKLESGFPSYVADQVIDKVSVDVAWSGYEYNNSKLVQLKQMMARVINTGELASISCEVVMRTRGNTIIRMYVPSCTFTSLPTFAPTNDYSDVQFQMSALKMTEFSTNPFTIKNGYAIDDVTLKDATQNGQGLTNLDIYNGWLSDTPIYSEIVG